MYRNAYPIALYVIEIYKLHIKMYRNAYPIALYINEVYVQLDIKMYRNA